MDFVRSDVLEGDKVHQQQSTPAENSLPGPFHSFLASVGLLLIKSSRQRAVESDQFKQGSHELDEGFVPGKTLLFLANAIDQLGGVVRTTGSPEGAINARSRIVANHRTNMRRAITGEIAHVA